MATDLERHDGVKALVQSLVTEANRGRWTRASATVESSPLDGSGMITVERDGHRQAMRYHLPETVDDIAELVHALLEKPGEWKSGHRRDYGRPG